MDDTGKEESRDASMENAPLSKELGDTAATIHTLHSTIQFANPDLKSANYALSYLSYFESPAQQPPSPSNSAQLTQQEPTRVITTSTMESVGAPDKPDDVSASRITNSEVDTSHVPDQRPPHSGPSPEQLKRLVYAPVLHINLTVLTHTHSPPSAPKTPPSPPPPPAQRTPCT